MASSSMSPSSSARAILTALLLALAFFPHALYAQFSEGDSVSVAEALKVAEASNGVRFTYRLDLIAGRYLPAAALTTSLEDLLSALGAVGIGYERKETGIILFAVQSPRETFHVVGRIVDSGTGEPLSFATVSWQESGGLRGVAANSEGMFVLSDSQTDEINNAPLHFSRLGYEPVTIALQDLVDLRVVRLTPAESSAPEVVVSDFLIETELDSAFARMLSPGLSSPLGETSVLRSLQSLPSVSISGGLSGGVSVRGSQSDGFQVLIDGMPVYSQTHFFGLFDALNADALRTVGFYYGIAPSSYQAPPGGTLSFVTRGGPQNRFEQSIALSNSSVKGLLGGPLPRRLGSWIVSGRQSILNQLQWFGNESLIEQGLNVWRPTSVTQTVANRRNSIFPGQANAEFYDVHAKVSADLSRSFAVRVSFYDGGDSSNQMARRFLPLSAIRNSNPVELSDVSTSYSWGSDASSLQLRYSPGGRAYGTLQVGVSHFNSDYAKDDFTYSIPPLGDRPQSGLTFVDTLLSSNDLRDGAINVDAGIVNPRGEILAGASVHRYRVAFSESSAIRDEPFDEHLGAILGEGYIEIRQRVLRGWLVQLGTRVHHFSGGRYTRLSPRVRIQRAGGRRIGGYLGYSRNYQFLHQLYIENTVGSYFWTLSRDGEPPGEADNFVGGLSVRPLPRAVLQIDGYAKRLGNLRQHESVVSRRRIRDAGAVLSPWVADTRGKSVGVELLARFGFGNVVLTHAYTLSRSTVWNVAIQEGRVFPAESDRRHQYAMRLRYSPGRGLGLDAAFYAASGVPNSLSFTDPAESERLGPYHRLDVSAVYDFGIGRANASMRIGVYNVYNRENPWYRTPVAVLNRDAPLADRITFTNADVYDLGILPSFELRLRL